MKVRPVVAYAIGAVVIAALSFALGSYVFPHEAVRQVAEDRSVPATPAPAEAESVAEAATLEAFGIDIPGTQSTPPVATPDDAGGAGEAPAPGAATPNDTVLRADDLTGLAEPVPGHLIGRLVSVDRAAGTVDVRVEESAVLIAAGDVPGERLAFPTGSKVTLVLPSSGRATDGLESLKPGVTVRAEIRIEPATTDRSGRIVAVSFEAMGSQQ